MDGKTNGQAPENVFSVAPGVWGRKDVFVNYYVVQDMTDDQWVLIDAGLKWSEPKIKELAAYVFGADAPPKAIVLTHGHFDHVGSLKRLAEEWDVPVYCHELEVPYLTDQSHYPPADPTVGGGLMASMAFLYPDNPINIWKHLKVLPANGNIPVLPEWEYIHTPGHAPGHISLYRRSDSVLIAGDAFVTTHQESALSVMTQKKEVSGPPKYFTCDWQAARTSVEKLAALHPATAATGHGQVMRGRELEEGLSTLVAAFDTVAVPAQGRYVPEPAITNAHGVAYLPPKKSDTNEVVFKAFGVTALLTLGLVYNSYKKQKRKAANETLLEVEYNY